MENSLFRALFAPSSSFLAELSPRGDNKYVHTARSQAERKRGKETINKPAPQMGEGWTMAPGEPLASTVSQGETSATGIFCP